MPDLNLIQERELEHPIRKRIWELYKKNPDCSFDARLIREQIAAPDDEISASQVIFHLRRLQKAELLPEAVAE